jgi:predicted enzyme related to lactoylglutathione lyase
MTKMNRIILSAFIGLCFAIGACNTQNRGNSEDQPLDSNATHAIIDMNSFVSIFEIPATDISRAINFYQSILDIKIEEIDMPGMQMGVFPYDGQVVTGVILKGEGYTPSRNGVTIYLNGGDNLQIVLDKVGRNGGEIVVPKTLHGDESGYFALFLDTEGNRVGLHSPN